MTRRIPTDPLKTTVEYTRGLFARLEEFFTRATGTTAARFATVASFGHEVRANAQSIAPRGEAAFRWLDSEVRSFQANRGLDAFVGAQQLGGMNLVLGGSSRFLGSELDSVSTAVLYSDTVLIPDPIMPWLERERTEEQFRHVLLLQAAHTLLQLKPLVDEELPYPAVVVFPSWEKSLEEHDQVTREGILAILTDLISYYIQEDFENFAEIVDFSTRKPEAFYAAIDRERLFVAPGGSPDEPLDSALERYEKEMRTWRSPEWLAMYEGFSPQQRVLNGLLERLAPIYHLIENAEELSGHPLMCLEQHAYYFELISRRAGARLKQLGLLDPKTLAIVNALSSHRLKWLGGLPADVLARLRRDQENVTFRGRLTASVNRLQEIQLEDVNRVAAEVCHDLEVAIAEHKKELVAIREKYARTHGQTAMLAAAAAVGALIPTLTPVLGAAAPVGLAAKYAHDKLGERAATRGQLRSLVGVLAAARSE